MTVRIRRVGRVSSLWAAQAAGALVLIAWVCSSQPLRAASNQYTFTRIADTLHNDAGLGGVNCVGVNNLGTVIVNFAPTGSATLQLWRGDGQSFTQVAPNAGVICSSINDLDETAYVVYNSPTNSATLVRNNNGTLTTLASNAVPPYLDASSRLYLPSLSTSGSAVYVSTGGPGGSNLGPGIYIAPSGNPVYNSATDPALTWSSPASMNDSLAVVFLASNPSTGKIGVYRGSAVPLIETGNAVSGGIINVFWSYRPVINNAGTVAFVGRLDVGGVTGAFGVYTTVDGTSVRLVGTNPTDRFALNNSGDVALRRASGGGTGIFAARSGSIEEAVIGFGDAIDGSTLQSAFLWEEAINDKRQIAFVAQLADGRTGVYRADPINHQPVASDGTASVTPGGSVSRPLSASDPDGDALTYSIVTNGTNGTAQITNAVTGTYTYTANAGSSGTDTFTYQVNDGFLNSSEATITVTITPSGVATNISASVAVVGQGSWKINKKTGRYTQTVTLQNRGATVAGPVSFVLDNLSSGATLFSAAGSTTYTSPAGSPYVNVDVGADVLLGRRETATVVLEFVNPSGQPMTYTVRVLAGAGNR